jgi:hypothetical protein
MLARQRVTSRSLSRAATADDEAVGCADLQDVTFAECQADFLAMLYLLATGALGGRHKMRVPTDTQGGGPAE